MIAVIAILLRYGKLVEEGYEALVFQPVRKDDVERREPIRQVSKILLRANLK